MATQIEPELLVRCGITALLVVLVVALLRWSGALQFADLVTWDRLVSLQAETAVADQRVAVILVSEADLQAIGEWPLSDRSVAQVITILEKAGASVIGLDIYRDRPVPPGTAVLQQKLRDNDRIIAVEKIGSDTDTGVLPPAMLAGTDRVGFSDLVVDPDGVVRRGLLFMDEAGTVSYSLGLRVALRYLADFGLLPRPDSRQPEHIALGSVSLPPFEADEGPYVDADARGYQLLFDFSAGSHPFATLSLSDLLEARYSENELRGKVVLLGVAAASVKDMFLTPWHTGLLNRSSVPGAVVHAHLVDQLLRAALDGERPLRSVGEGWQQLWMFIWGMLGGLVALRLRSLYSILLPGLAGLVILAGASLAAFHIRWWLAMAPAMLAWIGSISLVALRVSVYERSQRYSLMRLFEKHVSRDVANEIWNNRDQYLDAGRLRAREVMVTVLFADIEHFTSVAERLEPEQLMKWLNGYMEEMTNILIRFGGVVDDFYGDAIKANFGIPLARSSDEQVRQDAVMAVRCALEMRSRLAAFNTRCAADGLPRLRMRIGICTGMAVAGCLGSSERMKYTTIGDTVNTAARLEGFDKQAFEADDEDVLCRILAAASTIAYAGDSFDVRCTGDLSLRGKQQKIRVFQVLEEANKNL